MSGGAIEYISEEYEVSRDSSVLDTSIKNNIKCVFKGTMSNSYRINFSWEFDWNEPKSQGVFEITGHISIKSSKNAFAPVKIDVKLTEDNRTITKHLGGGCYTHYYVTYEYSLTPHLVPPEEPPYDVIFAPSDKNDAILVVDGKKLHVNKAFLSYHSDFFHALFSSNFKESQMDEIPIGDVSYEDFALLLSTFHPNPVLPTDENVEQFLEIASRFLVSSAMSIAERHLMNNSRINNEYMLYLADEYGMPTLLEKCIRRLNILETPKNFKRSTQYKRMSDSTKAKVLARIREKSTDYTIEYKSGSYPVERGTNVSETHAKNGIICAWSGKKNDSNQIDFTWKFYWDKLKSQGVDELSGHITVTSSNNRFPTTKIGVRLTENGQVVTSEIECLPYSVYVSYVYSFTPYYAEIPEKPLDYDEMFLPSDKNDTILVVEGKKFHVNKAFLSYHSDFFHALFSSNFKEGQMDEIPIGDVSFDDFALLLSTFYLNPVLPNDRNVEKLLEMARRFMVSSAMSSSENHLLRNSKLSTAKIIWLADEYNMPRLLDNCIRRLNTMEKANRMKKSQEYEQLSDETKLKVVDRIFKLSHI